MMHGRKKHQSPYCCCMHMPASNPRCCRRKFCELLWVEWVKGRGAGLFKQWIPPPGPNGCTQANVLSRKHNISLIKNKLLLNYQNLLQYEGLNDTVTKVYSLIFYRCNMHLDNIKIPFFLPTNAPFFNI